MKPTKHTMICTLIRTRILRGVYTDQLPGERALAKELKTDERTVRGAMIQLDALGLVERRPRRGTFVVARGPHDRPETQLSAYLLLPQAGPLENGSWHMRMLQAFEIAAARYGVKTTMESVDKSDPENVIKTVLSRSQNLNCVGVCLFDMVIDTPVALRLAQAAGPVVVIDWDLEVPVIPCVVFDNAWAGRLVAEHLLALGHRRVAFISHELHSPSYRDRWEGLESTFRAAGVSVPFVQVAQAQDAVAPVRKMLEGPEAPTALAFSSSDIGELVFEALAQWGIAVPDRLSLIGFEGVDRYVGCSLTATRFDVPAMTREAMDALLDDDLRTHPRRIVVGVQLIDYGSTAPPPK